MRMPGANPAYCGRFNKLIQHSVLVPADSTTFVVASTKKPCSLRMICLSLLLSFLWNSLCLLPFERCLVPLPPAISQEHARLNPSPFAPRETRNQISIITGERDNLHIIPGYSTLKLTNRHQNTRHITTNVADHGSTRLNSMGSNPNSSARPPPRAPSHRL